VFAQAMRRAFESLGATYLKLGQIVASSPGMFGEAIATEFRTCLDTGSAVPFDQVRRAVENDLCRPLETMFTSFDPDPIGRASLAVVHRATTLDGCDVAVKVLRPGIEDVIATDLALMTPLFELLADQLGMEIAGSLHMALD